MPVQSSQNNPQSKLADLKYKKKTQKQHILTRPDTYIGPVVEGEMKRWCWDEEQGTMTLKQVVVIPGLLQLFEEILSNAIDESGRSKRVTRIEVDIHPDHIRVKNNGTCVPTRKHSVYKQRIVTFLFFDLMSSVNYDDDETRFVGGRNGFGAKLTGLFSSKMIVQTCNGRTGTLFEQSADHLNPSPPVITKLFQPPKEGESWTAVTFYPDWAYFKRDGESARFNEQEVQVLAARVIEASATSSRNSSLEVVLNGRRISTTSLSELSTLHLGSISQWPSVLQVPPFEGDERELKEHSILYYKNNARFECVLAPSPRCLFPAGEAEMRCSFVNMVHTFHGGTHIRFVEKQIVTELTQLLKKEYGSSLKLTKRDISSSFALWINTSIQNPIYGEQWKATLASQKATFVKDLTFKVSFWKKLRESPVVQRLHALQAEKMAKALGRQEGQTRRAGKAELDRISNYTGAKYAGRKNKVATLILPEGVTAGNQTKAAFSVVGTDLWGVFTGKGKGVNVRCKSASDLTANDEWRDLIKIIGLVYGVDYTDDEAYDRLNYKQVLLMVDSDYDGNHIACLYINAFFFFWPSLLKRRFLSILATPVWSATQGVRQNKQVRMFFTDPEYRQWDASLSASERKRWMVKFYKGIGSSDAHEIKRYFRNLDQYQCWLMWHGDRETEELVDLLFTQDATGRCALLNCNRPEYEDVRPQREWPIRDFLKRMLPFGVYSNERGICSAVDGLKRSQRQALDAICDWKDNQPHPVNTVVGAMIGSERNPYHHGESSAQSTTVNLARDYLGTNNVNVLKRESNVGTRHDSVKLQARYINVSKSPIYDALFCPEDRNLLDPMGHFVPVIAWVLVNGSFGVGWGKINRVLPCSPYEVIRVTRERLLGQRTSFEDVHLDPYWRDFQGTVECIKQPLFSSVLPENAVKEMETKKRITKHKGLREAILRSRSFCTDPWGVVLNRLGFVPQEQKSQEPQELQEPQEPQEPLRYREYAITGCVALSGPQNTSAHITELPVGVKTTSYLSKLQSLEQRKKIVSFSSKMHDYLIDIQVQLPPLPDDQASWTHSQVVRLLHLKVTTNMDTGKMYMFDRHGIPRHFRTHGEIFEDHWQARLPLYQSRLGALRAKAAQRASHARQELDVLLAVADRRLIVERQSKSSILQRMQELFPSLSVERCRQLRSRVGVWSTCAEDLKEAERKHATLQAQHDRLQATTKEEMWLADLDRLERVIREEDEERTRLREDVE